MLILCVASALGQLSTQLSSTKVGPFGLAFTSETLEEKLDKKLGDISALRTKNKLTIEEAKKVRDAVVEKYLSDNGVGTPALPDSPPSSPVKVLGRR